MISIIYLWSQVMKCWWRGKVALITGVTGLFLKIVTTDFLFWKKNFFFCQHKFRFWGQDGSYLAELLLDKGYRTPWFVLGSKSLKTSHPSSRRVLN